jgi:hypothetical protein
MYCTYFSDLWRYWDLVLSHDDISGFLWYIFLNGKNLVIRQEEYPNVQAFQETEDRNCVTGRRRFEFHYKGS